MELLGPSEAGGLPESRRLCTPQFAVSGSWRHHRFVPALLAGVAHRRPVGAVVWQMGGSTPLRDPDTQHLPIVNDDEGEFCGQHQATLTAAGTIVLFDNGNHCHGPRKEKSPQLTRVVEYDISSGTQAVFMRDFALGADHGYTVVTGGVTVLENGHWLITWGGVSGRSPSLGPDETIAVSEVDPVTGSALFHMNMLWGGGVPRVPGTRGRRQDPVEPAVTGTVCGASVPEARLPAAGSGILSSGV